MTDQTVNETPQSNVNTVFWIISVIAVLWNLMGVAAFGMDMTVSEESLELMSEAQRKMYEQNPMWLKLVYGVATIGGLIASIGLIMKKKWCINLFLVSLVAIVIQFGYVLFGTEAFSISGPTAAILPSVVILYAAFLWYYSKQCDKRGWLS